VIEDILRMYAMEKPSKWEYYLHLVEFSYKNGYQESLKMSPFDPGGYQWPPTFSN
jgi:hypothetical protein